MRFGQASHPAGRWIGPGYRLARKVPARLLSHGSWALCEQTVSTIRNPGGEAFAIQTDVADEQPVERLMADTVACYGRIDILVNNAGIGG